MGFRKMVKDERQQRLEAATKKRDDLQRQVDRAEIRLEAARKDLLKVEEECKKKKLSPEQLPEAITKLQDRFNTEIHGLEDRILKAERSLDLFAEVKI